MHPYILGATQLESSLAEKELGVLVDQTEHEPTMCPCCKEDK